MATQKQILDIMKDGLWGFEEEILKEFHGRELVGRLPISKKSQRSRLKSCKECNRFNLKPRHSQNECPSENFCFCKSRRREKRPCPNEICDFIYEGIIENHMKFSPNLKTTDISQWTVNYWEIASCYMKHRSESAEKTELLDLLHLVLNNRFILKKFLPETSNASEERKELFEDKLKEIRDKFDKVIKICCRVKTSAGIFSLEDIRHLCSLLSYARDNAARDNAALEALENLGKIMTNIGNFVKQDWFTESEFESRIRDGVSKHFEKSKNTLRCKIQDTNSTHLQLSFEQKLLICQTENEAFTLSNITDVIFCDDQEKVVLVKCTEELKTHDHRWNQKEWFLYNLLELYFISHDSNGIERSFRKDMTVNGQFTDIFVVSKSISNRIDMPLQTFCEGIRNKILPKRQRCLVVLDFCDEIVKTVFANENDVFGTHTLIILLADRDSDCDFVYGKGKRLVHVKTQPVRELALRNVGKKLSREQKNVGGIFTQLLYKSVRKIGEKNLSTVTCERIRFADNAKTLKFSNIPQLKTLKLRECSFTPLFGPCLVTVELYHTEKLMSLYVEQVKQILYSSLHSSVGLQHIVTSDIKIGRTSFSLKLNLCTLEKDAEEYLGVNLRNCDKEVTSELIDIEMAKILHAADCNCDDFEMSEKEEKVHILRGIKYGLCKSDPNFVHVFPAERYQEGVKSGRISFVCFMKDNFDIDKECSWKTYRGFDIFLRSFNQVSPESSIAETPESSEAKDEKLKESTIERLQHAADVVTFNLEELMENHSNLEMIGVSMGKAKEKNLDTTDGPYVVLYVRLKSFIPYGEKPFPSTLQHPHESSVILKTDIREGYYLPLRGPPDGIIQPSMKQSLLAMGCSIGFLGSQNAGTLGPFVEIESDINGTRTKEMGFLTVCHLFSLPCHYQFVINERGEVVQPSASDGRERDDDTVCGQVVACEYSEKVDAALIRITRRHPQKGQFITCSQEDLEEAGFSTAPEYNDGSIVSVKDCFRKNIVKFGKKTKLTLGQCRFQAMAVKVTNERLAATCPVHGTSRVIFLRNLLQIKGFGNQMFSDSGDSGAGIFLVENDNRLSCAGIINGKTSDGFAVATPIQTILSRLSASSLVSTQLENCKLTMKTFQDQL